jgi:hypothetical protein
VWNPETNFESCLGLLLERIRRFAWVSIKVASISAMDAAVFDVNLLGIWDQVYWGDTKNWEKGGCGNSEVVVAFSAL